MKRILYLIIIFSLLGFSQGQASYREDSSCVGSTGFPMSISLDGVHLQGCLPFQPDSSWVQPQATQLVQTAYTQGSGASFTVTAIPFGRVTPSEIFPPVDGSSSEESLRQVLRQARVNQGAQLERGPAAQLFGRQVESLVSTLSLPDTPSKTRRIRLTEWLVIAGERLWVFRAAQPEPLFGIAAAQGLVLSSNDLTAASTSSTEWRRLAMQAARINPRSNTASEPSDLPTPTWWSGLCDTGRYYGAYPLGTSYHNLPACGPLPGMGYPDVLVYFYPDAFPVLEWECIELVMRFLYLAYGVAPYPANGSGVVYNYTGSRMTKISNGVIGKAPQPGDVISYCPGCTYGHASIVIESSVNGFGNGYVVVMEQNWTWTGQTTLPVSNWTVIGDAGWVYGWLHPATVATPTPSPTPTCTPRPTRTPAAAPLVTTTPAPYQLFGPYITITDPCA